MLKFTKLQSRFDNSYDPTMVGTQTSDMNAAKSDVSSAANQGQTAINSYDPVGASTNAIGTTTNLFGTAQGQNKLATDPLAAAIAKNPTVTDLYKMGNTIYNVEPLKTEATNLTNAVNNALPSGYSGARGFDINADQISNGAALKTAYLTPQQNSAVANANTASGLASSFVNAGLAQNQFNLIPAQTNASIVGNEIAAEQTGWNADLAKQLDGLLAKMQSGEKLSEAEMAAATNLASLEENFNSAVATQNLKNQFQITPQGSNLTNTFVQSMMNPSMLTSKTGVATYG